MYRKLEKSNKCRKDICRKATGIKKSRGRGQEIYDQILKFDAEREAELYQYIEKVQNQFTRCTAQYNKTKNNYYQLAGLIESTQGKRVIRVLPPGKIQS